MSAYQSSAPLTAALLASKGSAAPSGSASSPMNDLVGEGYGSGDARREVRHDGTGPGPARITGGEQDLPVPERAPAAAKSAGGRVKLSLRLDEDQHLRLKLAAAHLRQSGQTLLMAALDDYLSRHVPDVRNGNCACLMTREDGGPFRLSNPGEPYGNAD